MHAQSRIRSLEVSDINILKQVSKMFFCNAIKVIIIEEVEEEKEMKSIVFSKEKQNELAIKLGKGWKKTLCEIAGVPASTFYSWCQKNKINMKRIPELNKENFIKILSCEENLIARKIQFSIKNQEKISNYFGIKFCRGWQKKLAEKLGVTAASISSWIKQGEINKKYLPEELIDLLKV